MCIQYRSVRRIHEKDTLTLADMYKVKLKKSKIKTKELEGDMIQYISYLLEVADQTLMLKASY